MLRLHKLKAEDQPQITIMSRIEMNGYIDGVAKLFLNGDALLLTLARI